MILYIIGSNGYFQGTMEWPDDPEEIRGIPYGTTKRATPEIQEGFYAIWNGSGWTLTSNPPPPEVTEENLVITEGENNESVNSDPNV